MRGAEQKSERVLAADVPLGIQAGVLRFVEDLYWGRGSQTSGSASPAAMTAKDVLSPFDAHRRDLRYE